MDEKLLNALKVGKMLDTINRHKKLVYEQYIEDATFYLNGGRFIATDKLVSFVQTIPTPNSRVPDPKVIVVDEDNIPIEVDGEYFTNIVLSQYNIATKKYYNRYQEISNTIRDNSV